MRYKAEDLIWYHAQFTPVEYEGVFRGPAYHQFDVTEPTYVVTLLSGPYSGQTSNVYESELRPLASRTAPIAPSTPRRGSLVEVDPSV